MSDRIVSAATTHSWEDDVPATWENDTSSVQYHRARARAFFDRYLALQRKIEDIERNAGEAAQGHKRAQKHLLTDTSTEAGFTYRNLCGERDMCMEVAQLSATMAIALR